MIIAFSIFIVVKGINKLRFLSKKEEAVTLEKTTKEEQLLTEIKDILKGKITKI